MGLDAYAYTKGKDATAGPEIAYWRKHNRLQGWMENLWHSKNPSGGEFNCVKLFLTLEDIEALERDIEAKDLPETSGFFFGNDSYSYAEEGKPYADYDADKKFIADAKEALDKGHEVYYSCWW
jgi:hypothetical protein